MVFIGPELAEVARLDTCVTVVDAAEFYANLATMNVYEEGDTQGTITELMTEQIEFSNVIILNKTDLVTKEQQSDIMDRLSILNPKAKIVTSQQSKINVKEILNTHLYDRKDMEEDSVMISATRAEAKKEEMESCCVETIAKGKKRCCNNNIETNEVDSGLSKILLGVLPTDKGKNKKTRHEERFGISSFVYRARRPFHPERLYEQFLKPYFIMRYEEVEGHLTRSHVHRLQKEANEKQVKRIEFMGELLRSKGFVWIPTSHKIIGAWQQAGNVLRIEGNIIF